MAQRWIPKLLISLAITLWSMATFLIIDQPLWAQEPISAELGITGIVEGPNGPVAGAIVRVQNSSIKTTTADDGSFTLSGLMTDNPVRVTAAARGYYIRWADAVPGQEPVTIVLERHPLVDNNEGYKWQSAEACGECHTAFNEWLGDAHAQSAVNPRFLTMYLGTDIHGNKSPRTELNTDGTFKPADLSKPYYGPGFRLDTPDRMGNCAACHTPMASTLDTGNSCGWSGCHSDFTTQNSDEIPPAVNPTGLTGVAAEGINCDFCHKIGRVSINEEKGIPDFDKPGILSLSIYRPNEDEELLFGTVDDVSRIADSYLPLQAESAFCAGCHYGAITHTVIYNSFGEWLESPYSDPETGQTCQDCHMPVVEANHSVFPEMAPEKIRNYFVYPEKGGLRRNPNLIHNHKMLGVDDEEFMRNAVSMETTARLEGNELLIEVAIINRKAGHHLPTGSPLRNMILVVQASDAQGNVLPLQNGSALPDWAGNYSGQPGRGYAKILLDTLTGEAPSPAQWRPVSLVDDTRIPALTTDISQYTFAASSEGPVSIEAKLVYRRAFQQLSEWKGWNDPDFVMAENKIEIKQN